MAQYNKNVEGLNVYTEGNTLNSSVDVTNLNQKGISNVTLLDDSAPIMKKGSEISSKLTNKSTYAIYGCPEKWILDREQQYNNCGVESSMNILSISGLYDIKDQTKTEDEFTFWAITNKFENASGEDETYAEDLAPIGQLNLLDGATTYDSRKALLEHYGLETTSLGNLAEDSVVWFEKESSINQEWKDLLNDYENWVDEYNYDLEEYNKCVKRGDTKGASEWLSKMTNAKIYVDSTLKTYISVIVSAWNEYFTKTYGVDSISKNIENVLREGKAIIMVGDARYLWPNYTSDDYVGHAITALGLVCDANDNAVGVYVQDTGNPDIGFTFLTMEEVVKFITSNGNNYWDGPIQMNVTVDNIKKWANPTTAYGNKYNNILTGNSENNLLNGNAGNDQLFGNAGDDTLDGGDGDDTLIGGAGNDLLYGGKGNDTYVFSTLGGNDIVDLGAGGSDKLIFTDLKFENLSFEKSDFDLVITYNKLEEGKSSDESTGLSSGEMTEPAGVNGSENTKETAETVTLKNYFKAESIYSLIEVQDSTGGTKKLISLISGNIPIKFNENEATLVHGTFLDDDITAPEDNIYDDTIYGGSGNDTIITYGGNDLIYGDSYDEEDENKNDSINSNSFDDYIEGGLGDDTIHGELGHNTIVFNADNEIKNSEDGDDVSYVGDGNDVVYSGKGIDALVFKGVKYENLKFSYEGDNLVIRYGLNPDNLDSKVTIVDYLKDGKVTSSVRYIVDEDNARYDIQKQISGFLLTGEEDQKNVLKGSSLSDTIYGANLSDTIYGGNGNDYIEGKDGHDFIDGEGGEDYISGGAGNDEIYGGAGDDIISGETGNDKLYGGTGDNQFIFNLGDGNDTIYSGAGKDTLVFNDVAVDELKFINDNNGNLVIKNTQDESTITIEKYFEKRGASSVSNVIDKTGKCYYLLNLLDDIEISANNLRDNTLNGTFLSETINTSANNDTVYGGLGNDTINGFVGNDVIYGGDGDDIINGGAGNDVLYGENGNNEIYGGTGNDTINAGTGENRIYFNVGDGNDTLLVGKGIDTLVFKDFEFSKLEYAKDPYSNDLIIRYGNKDIEGKYTDSVTIKDYFNTKVKKSIYRIEALYKVGQDEVITREMNFIINDKDTVINIESPDFNINNIVGSIYNDSILGGDALEHTKNTYNGGDGHDTIVGNVREDLIYGGNGNDVLYGGDDRDTIYGGNGDDTIYGENGSDLLSGDAGENVFHFTAVENTTGDVHLLNNDTVISGRGSDTLFFDNAKSSELKFLQSGNDLIIKYGSTDAIQNNNSVTIANYFALRGNVSVTTIKTVEGQDAQGKDIVKIDNLRAYMTDKVLTVLGKDDVQNYLVGSYNNDEIYGGNLADTLRGANGDDTIYGGEGNDKLYGDNGNDMIDGGAGNDFIDGGAGDDALYGGDNDDTIYGGYGNDSIYGNHGDDVLYSVSGVNNYYFADGDGNDTVISGKGSDILNFTTAAFEDMTFIRSGNDLLIQYNASGDTVTLSNYARNASTSIHKLIDKNNNEHDIQAEVTVLFEGSKGARNRMSGTYMKDSIIGGYYNDTIDGGNGDDTIYGNRGNDSLLGGNGNDVIYGDTKTPSGSVGIYDDNDVIRGGNGDDSIYGGYGNDSIFGDAGTNNIYLNETNYDGNDAIYSGRGYDILNFKDLDLSDLKFTRSGNSLVITYTNQTSNNQSSATIVNYFKNTKSSIKEINTKDGNHQILSDADIKVDIESYKYGKNKITGTFLNDSLVGGDYNDTLNGGSGNDTIVGGAGNDIIYAGAGDDVINGGTGDDRLYAQTGNNTFEFKAGDGVDVLYGGNGHDHLVFYEIDSNNVQLTRVGNNLEIAYTANDKVIVVNYFRTNGVVNMTANFNDGNRDLKQFYNASVNPIDIASASRKVNGTTLNDNITATGLNQRINAGQGNDSITGSNGNDSIYAGMGDDTIRAGKGNDRIYGEAGTNEIYFETGDGQDVVYSGRGRDTLHFDVTDLSDLNFARSGNNLVILYGNANDSVTVANYFKNANSSVKEIVTNTDNAILLENQKVKVDIVGNQYKKNKINGTFLNDSLVGGDYNDTLNGGNGNDTIVGGAGNDIIHGGNGNDTIVGGRGDDRLYGDAGENTFEFEAGDGNDVIYSTRSLDTLKFKDAELSNLEFAHDSRNNLIIIQKDATGEVTNTLTIVNYFGLGGKTSVVAFRDKNDNLYQFSEKDGNLVFTDSLGVETIKIVEVVGNDNAKNKLYGTYLNDSITGGALNDTISSGNGDDTIVAGYGNDLIYGGNGDDEIYADTKTTNDLNGGNDKVYAGNGRDSVYGGAGNDVIYGENGEDYIIGGMGNDYIDGGNDDDYLEGNFGNDTLRGGNGDDTLYGGTGDDILYGDAGNNQMLFKFGDGQDIVYSGAGTDTLVFKDVVDVSNLKFRNDNGSLVISYNDSNDYDKVVLANYFKISSSVKYIQDKNDNKKLLIELLSKDGEYILMDGRENVRNSLTGTVYNDKIIGGNLADTIVGGYGHDYIEGGLSNDNLYGGDGRDTIIGGDGNDYLDGGNDNDSLLGGLGNDVIHGGNGDDYIEGNAGNDALYGEAGVNTFHFAVGDGNDVVYSGAGHDILDFGTLDLATDFRFVKNGNDLIIYYGTGSSKIDSVTIASYFRGVSSVNTIVANYNGEKTKVDIKDFATVEVEGLVNKSNKLYGTSLDDSITGGALNDTLVGGDGEDLIIGGAGNDYITGDRDNDTIYGGTGNDVIYGGTGNDLIYGGLDNDKLYGDAGENTFVFNDGDGRDTIYSGSGTDTLEFVNIKADDLNFVYDKASGSLIINYGSRGYDYVYLDSYLKNFGETSVKYVVTQDPANPANKVTIKLVDLVNQKNVHINAEAKKVTEGTVLNDIVTSDNKGAVTVNTGNGNDLINGGDFNDTLNGGADNDTIYGNGGSDVINGGAGNDELYGGAGYENYLYGDAGNDVLTGDANSHYDYLYGGSGNDTINQKSTFFTEAYGGDGNDTYNISILGNTKISDSAGNDDKVILSLDKDYLGVYFDVGLSTDIFAETTNNDLYLYDSSKLVDILKDLANSKDLPMDKLVQIDNYFGSGLIETVQSKDHYSLSQVNLNEINVRVSDWLSDNHYSSTKEVFESGDIAKITEMLALYNAEWDLEPYIADDKGDSIQGGDADDIIYGGKGNDTLKGGAGNDKIYSGGGKHNYLYGEDGNDTLFAQEDATSVDMYGGTGNDDYDLTGLKGIKISDDSGIDRILVNKLNSNIKVFFHVGNSSDEDLFLYDADDTQSIVRDLIDNVQAIPADKLTQIKNYFGTGKIEEVLSINSYSFTETDIDTVKTNVTNWLATKGFTSTQEVFELGTSVEIAEMMALYNVNWTLQPYIGTDGDDSIEGTIYQDSIYGRAGNDTINGNDGDDLLYGEDGDDVIRGNAGNDTIYAGAGNDMIFGDDGNNLIVFNTGDGNDTIYGGTGSDTIKFADKTLDDLNLAYDLETKDVTVTTNDGDTVCLNALLSGDIADSSIKYVQTKNSVDGSQTVTNSISDFLNARTIKIQSIPGSTTTGTAFNDEITGSLTADTIYGGDGNDTIIGSLGDDALYGEAGENLFVLNSGDGNDTIYSGNGTDTIKFTDKTLDDLSLSYNQDTDDLTISYDADNNDNVVISALMSDVANSSIKYIETVDANNPTLTVKTDLVDLLQSKVIHVEAIADTTTTGTAYNDEIIGSTGDDEIHGGEGNDTIIGGTGNDKFYGDEDENLIVLNIGDGNDTIYGGTGSDTIKFADKTLADLSVSYDTTTKDIIISTDDSDSICINELLNDDVANSSIKFIETKDETDDTKTVKTALSDFIEAKIIKIVATADTTTNGTIYSDDIEGSVGDDTIYGDKGNDIIQCGAGNDYVDGGNGNDTIYSNEGSNTIIGGKGDDVINTQNGKNLIVFNDGDGNDVIHFGANSGNSNTIKFADNTADDLTVSYNGNNGYTITYGTGGQDNLLLDFENPDSSSYSNKSIETQNATDPSKTVTTNLVDFMNSRTVHVQAVKETTTEGSFFNDEITGSDGKDTINGNAGNDVIYGNEEADVIHGGDGNDTIYGGTGNDKLYGDAGENLIVFNTGDGNDTIYGGNGTDTIKFVDKTLADLTVSYNQNTKDIILSTPDNDSVCISALLNGDISSSSIKYVETKDEIDGTQTVKTNLKDLISSKIIHIQALADAVTEGTAYNDEILGTTGSDEIRGGAGNDTIVGGKGNDKFYGEAGENLIILNTGDGNDTIYGGNGKDTIRFADKTFADLTVSYDQNTKDVIISTDDNDSISISSLMSGEISNSSIKYIETKNPLDETQIVRTNLLNLILSKAIQIQALENETTDGTAYNDRITGSDGKDTINGNAGYDLIYGEDGDDEIYGGAGNDTIYGGKGNDKFYGEAGENVIVLNTGDGNDTIYSGNGTDTIKFADKTLADLIVSYNQNTKDITISTADNDSICINALLSGNVSSSSIKNVETQDSFTDTQTVKTGMADFLQKNTILVQALADTTTDGTMYNDRITGSDGKDTINGNAGNDVIYAGDEDDSILGGDGNDSLYGEDGDDVIRGNAGNDTICGGKGNDKLYGDAGENLIVFNDGDGNDTIYSGNGTDTIKFVDKTVNDLVVSYNQNTKDITIKTDAGDSVCINALLSGNVSSSSIKYVETKDIFNENQTATTSMADFLSSKVIKIQALQATKTEGTVYNDSITGSAGSDSIYGGTGDDIIFSGAGDYDYLSGDVGNDTLYAGESVSIDMYGGAGNDVIYTNEFSTSTKAYGGAGDDTYNLASLEGVYISDDSGNDSLNINKGKDDIQVFFNIGKDNDRNLYLYDLAKQSEFYEKLITTQTLPTDKLTQVVNYFSTGALEEVKSNDSYSFSVADINSIKATVEAWLTTENYMSTQEVFESGNSAKITEMLNLYSINWQQQ